jgi:hypothetical protein
MHGNCGKLRLVRAIVKKLGRALTTALVLFCIAFLISCKSSGSIDILGPTDETAEAAKIVLEANKNLKEIKVLYEKHEGKREELGQAMKAQDSDAVRKISDEVVYLINDGVKFGTTALENIDQARGMEINSDYEDYLRLKSEALKKQLEAFEQYRQAAIKLRNNYDPKNDQIRETVTQDFKERSEKFRELMEKSRDYSSQANELAKDALKKPQE